MYFEGLREIVNWNNMFFGLKDFLQFVSYAIFPNVILQICFSKNSLLKCFLLHNAENYLENKTLVSVSL